MIIHKMEGNPFTTMGEHYPSMFNMSMRYSIPNSHFHQNSNIFCDYCGKDNLSKNRPSNIVPLISCAYCKMIIYSKIVLVTLILYGI